MTVKVWTHLSAAMVLSLAAASVSWAQVTNDAPAGVYPQVTPGQIDANASVKDWRGDLEADRVAKGWRRDDGFGEDDRRFDGRTYFNTSNRDYDPSWANRRQFGAGTTSRGPIRPPRGDQQTYQALYWMMQQQAAENAGR